MIKKILIGVGLVGLCLIAFIVYHKFINVKLYPEKNLGGTQVLVNQTGQAKTVKIKQAGYYDIMTISGTDKIVAVGAPLVGETLVGQYFKKDDTLTMDVDGEIQLKPAKLQKFSGHQIEINNPGNYYVGSQIPVGTYQVSFKGNLTDEGLKEGGVGTIMLNVKQLGAQDDEITSYKLDNQTIETSIKLKQNDVLMIKSNNQSSVVLTQK